MTSPVTPRFPLMVTLLCKLISPLAAKILKSWLKVSMVLSEILKSPVSILLASINVMLPRPSSNIKLVPIVTRSPSVKLESLL